MLIEALLNAIAGLLDLLLYPLQLAQLPDQIRTVFATILVYIADGCAIVAAYTHFTYLIALLGVCIAVDALHTAYIIIMWILRKIPLLNIS